jgi:hypothetical protein
MTPLARRNLPLEMISDMLVFYASSLERKPKQWKDLRKFSRDYLDEAGSLASLNEISSDRKRISSLSFHF